MHYKITREWLNIAIDAAFPFPDLEAFFQFFCISKKQRYQLIQEQLIYLDHQPIQNPHCLLIPGKQLRLHILQKQKIDYLPDSSIPLDVCYENAFCLIVNKPAGIIIHGETKEQLGTLANAVAYYYHQHHLAIPVRFIHRLDKETSGLVFFSKLSFFQPYYDECLKNKQISRHYLAIVNSKVPWKDYDCALAIGKDRHQQNKYIAYSKGKNALTHFHRITTKDNKTLLSCRLETGRTHQIRVHLASLGYPIINDAIYGTISNEQPMALQAMMLEWIDPLSQQSMTYTLPLEKQLNIADYK